MKKKPENSEMRLHRWFGTVFKEILTPLGLEVHTEYPVMADPPEADIVIIRKKTAEWTPEQLGYLPDGVRQSTAGHTIIEFKHTESLSNDSFLKTGTYRIFYRDHRKLKDSDVRVFLASSKTPSRKIMEKYGYGPSGTAGVYSSSSPILNVITLISLNDLADEPHNAICRLFASKKKEKARALLRVIRSGIGALPEAVTEFIVKFADLVFQRGGADMKELTSEERELFSRVYHNIVVPNLPLEERLKGIPVKEVLKAFPAKELLKAVPAKERLKGLSPEELDEIENTLRELRKAKKKKLS
jgi:hypothetical protein